MEKLEQAIKQVLQLKIQDYYVDIFNQLNK